MKVRVDGCEQKAVYVSTGRMYDGSELFMRVKVGCIRLKISGK